MSRLVLFCCILFVGHQYVSGVLDYNYEYVPEAGVWLRLHIVPANWKNAFRRCQLEGGVLASPSSYVLAKAMLSIMTENKVSRSVFTGIHALVSEGDYLSLDGVPLSDIHLEWAEGEPSATEDSSDPDNNENCVVLTRLGEASDVSCTSKYPYFCRRENASMTILNEKCQTTAAGYKYEPRTNSCYKLHTNAKKWHEAAKVCHSEGGHLAVVNSDEEAEVLKEIFAMYPPKTVTGAKHDDVAIVGVWKWDDNRDGDWLTIYGQPISEAGFAKWGSGQPNNYGGVQHMTSIQRSGLLDDIAHYDREPFFCEINVGNQY
ncbi:secretory phospholipase A2 receptor-like [Leguminivora glycinivorella]|uniref:secretory phospholipase A2 receptor-like n=1 Tax=Leguminivora glycinivorella TaxID=1035111 RepID=UPI00201093BB|nr:secretory phospholipase A2 receptor-like [Leguminivora glycinivorella]